MIPAISAKSEHAFKIINGDLKKERLTEFPDALIRDAIRKIILIVENFSVHKAKVASASRKVKGSSKRAPSIRPRATQ